MKSYMALGPHKKKVLAVRSAYFFISSADTKPFSQPGCSSSLRTYTTFSLSQRAASSSSSAL